MKKVVTKAVKAKAAVKKVMADKGKKMAKKAC
jgi:hypothetical protein